GFVCGVGEVPLGLERAAEILCVALVNQLLVAVEALRHDGEHVFSKLACSGEKFFRRNDAIDKPPFVSLLGTQEIAGKRKPLRTINADGARQLLAEAPARQNADTGMRICKARIL